MLTLLKFLILSLNTIDGKRNSAKYMLENMNQTQIKDLKVPTKKEKAILNKANLQEILDPIIKRFKMLKIRMKISFMAFRKNMTVFELFYQAILASYQQLKCKNLLTNPWPKIDKAQVNKILGGEVIEMGAFNHQFCSDGENNDENESDDKDEYFANMLDRK